MAHLAACALVWALTFLLVPVRRIAALWRAVAISLVWMILVDNLMAGLGTMPSRATGCRSAACPPFSSSSMRGPAC